MKCGLTALTNSTVAACFRPTKGRLRALVNDASRRPLARFNILGSVEDAVREGFADKPCSRSCRLRQRSGRFNILRRANAHLRSVEALAEGADERHRDSVSKVREAARKQGLTFSADQTHPFPKGLLTDVAHGAVHLRSDRPDLTFSLRQTRAFAASKRSLSNRARNAWAR